MAEHLFLTQERVDDLPLLIGLMERLQLPDLLDRHLGKHGNHQGLSNGWLAAVWLAFILSEGDHCKSHVQEWADRHTGTLERLTHQPLRPTEFTDDRLGILLEYLGDQSAWEALEADLWQQTIAVYELPLTGVRLDSTTSYGYHTPSEGGLMQVGFSKDHRPGSPQLKLMAAALEGGGHLVAADVCPGQSADTGLYLPLIARIRSFLGRSGLLYTGDCKMAALGTRAAIVAQEDYYLMPLPRTGVEGEPLDEWVEAVVAGTQEVTLLWEGEKLLGYGYECTREQETVVDGVRIAWRERVLVQRSLTLARQQAEALEERLQQAEVQLEALRRTPGRRQRAYRDEASLAAAVEQILTRFRVKGLLHVTWERHEEVDPRSVAPRRPGPGRPRTRKVKVRYGVTKVQRDTAAIEWAQDRLGWRALVTNVPAERLELTAAVLHYRGAWRLERSFHVLKGKPLGIRPLCVRNDDQIAGLTRLLTLGLRLLTLIEVQVRRGIEQSGEPLAGLDPGQPKRAIERPTGVRLLRAFARAEITLTRVQWGAATHWHLTPLSPLLLQVLAHLGLSASLYTRLIQDSS
jgi:transposase